MKIDFGPRGMLQIDEAHIVYRNFSGNLTRFNREGDRNFAVVIPDMDMADVLQREGWKIKIKEPREDGDEPFIVLPVKIKFNGHGPKIYLRSGNSTVQLDEETVGLLDETDIVSVDLDVRPYDWSVNGKSGRTAYLKSIFVTQEVDRFAEMLAEEESPEEEGPEE